MDTTTAYSSIDCLQATLDPVHFLLAYAGMLLHLLVKLGEVYHLDTFDFKVFMKKNLISTIISIVGIPVLLVMATDTAMSEFLPINYVTSVLAGWQTQSLFKSVFTVVGNRKGINTNGDGVNS